MRQQDTALMINRVKRLRPWILLPQKPNTNIKLAMLQGYS